MCSRLRWKLALGYGNQAEQEKMCENRGSQTEKAIVMGHEHTNVPPLSSNYTEEKEDEKCACGYPAIRFVRRYFVEVGLVYL